MKRSYNGPPGGTPKKPKMRHARKGPSLAMRVARLEKATEWKAKDFYKTSSQSDPIWNTAGVVTPIFELSSGSGPDQRIGRKVTIKSIQLHWGLENRTVTADGSVFPVRTMIIYDKQSNGVTPAYYDIISDQLGSGDAKWSFKNLQNKDRFVVLYDSFGATEAGDSKSRDSVRVNYGTGESGTSKDNEVYFGKVYRTMDFPCIFSEEFDRPITGAVYVVTAGNQGGSGSGSGNSGTFCSRVRYVDE